MKIISLFKDGKRIDVQQEEFKKAISPYLFEKGGPGSGKRPGEGYDGKGEFVSRTKESGSDVPMRRETVEAIKTQEKVKSITDGILNGTDKYFGYAHFDTSNMADYQMMSDTINDMAEVYGIDPALAADITQSLTHNHKAYEREQKKMVKGGPGSGKKATGREQKELDRAYGGKKNREKSEQEHKNFVARRKFYETYHPKAFKEVEKAYWKYGGGGINDDDAQRISDKYKLPINLVWNMNRSVD